MGEETAQQNTTQPDISSAPVGKKKIPLLVIILIVLLISALLAAIYFAYENQQIKQKESQDQTLPNPKLLPTITSIPSITSTPIVATTSATNIDVNEVKVIFKDKYSLDDLLQKERENSEKYGTYNPPHILGVLEIPNISKFTVICYDDNSYPFLQYLENDVWVDSCNYKTFTDYHQIESGNIPVPVGDFKCTNYVSHDELWSSLSKYDTCNDRMENYKRGSFKAIYRVYVNCESPTGNWENPDPSWCDQVDLESNVFEIY